MDSVMIVANWKSHQTETEAHAWLKEMESVLKSTQKTIIICPPFTILSGLFQEKRIQEYSFAIGAQNISPFEMGAYTGEINAQQIKEFASYVIIGHSERRIYFHEDDVMLTKKVVMAVQAELTPIFCVQSEETFIPNGVKIVAYEPVAAIGSGHADSPEEANAVAVKIKEKNPDVHVLYGGSVTAQNVSSFTHMSDLHGVLVGGASLDPKEFSEIITHA